MPGYSVSYTVIDEATAKIEAINKKITQLRAPLERQARSMQRFINVSGLNQVANSFSRIEQTVLGAAGAIGRMLPGMAALTGAASLAGLAKLVTDFGNLSEELTKSSQLLGVSPERLSGVQQAMRSIGGDIDAAVGSLRELRESSYDAALGMNTVAAGAFARMRIPLLDANRNFRDSIDLQTELFRALDAMPDSMDRYREAVRAGGQETWKTYQAIKAAGISVDEYRARQERMQTISRENLKTFEENRLSLAELNSSFYRLSVRLAGSVAPAFTRVFRGLSEWLDNPQNQERLTKFTESFGSGLLTSLTWAGTHLDTLMTTAEIVAGIFITRWGIKAVAGVVSLATAIGRATIAIGALDAAMVGLTGGTAFKLFMRGLGALGLAGGAAAGAVSAYNNPDVRPGAGLWKSIQNILHGRAPWAEYLPGDRQQKPGGSTSWMPPANMGTPGPATADDPRGMTPIIRAAAEAYGHDPDVAVRVAKAEGLRNFLGDQGRSGSAFQLFTGGGLGNEFQRQTGKSPLDPANESAAIWWAMQNLGTTGWAPYHGAARVGVGPREGIGRGAAAGGRVSPNEMAFYQQYAPFPAIGGRTPPPAQWVDKFPSIDPSKLTERDYGPGSPFGRTAPAANGPAVGPLIPGGALANGAVDVTITHRNAPAGTQLAATGTGNGINLAPPRIEHQEFGQP